MLGEGEGENLWWMIIPSGGGGLGILLVELYAAETRISCPESVGHFVSNAGLIFLFLLF